MYKHLEKINVKSNLPEISNLEYTAKKFRSPSEICQYDCSLEESIVKSSESSNITHNIDNNNSDQSKPSYNNYNYSINRNNRNNSNTRNSFLARNEEIMKSLAELKGEISPTESNQKNVSNTKNNEKEINKEVKETDNVTILRMKAQTAAELYLNVDDTKTVLRFLDFYVSIVPVLKSKVSDPKLVQAFNLFEEDVVKAEKFIEVSEELEELGFEGNKVTSALLLFSNDREAALDFLMKN